MVQIVRNQERIQYDDGFDLYPNRYVLLGTIEEYEDISGVKSGVVLAIGDKSDKDAMWELYFKYLFSGQYEATYLTYFGDVEVSGVYV